MIAAIASPDATYTLSGEINGDGSARRSAQGALDGSAKIGSAEGRISYPDRPEQPLLAYTGLAVDATFAPQAQRIVVQGKLSDGGSIDGTIGITGPEQNLSGQIQLGLGSLAFVELLTTEVANTKGKVDGRLAFAGTVVAPVISGQILLDGFATEIPEAGLKLADGKVQIDLGWPGRHRRERRHRQAAAAGSRSPAPAASAKTHRSTSRSKDRTSSPPTFPRHT